MSRAAKGADCKSAGYAFAGSSPASPTTLRPDGATRGAATWSAIVLGEAVPGIARRATTGWCCLALLIGESRRPARSGSLHSPQSDEGLVRYVMWAIVATTRKSGPCGTSILSEALILRIRSIRARLKT